MDKVIGFELNSQNSEAAATFYANVFGWEVSTPNWGYRSVNTGGLTGGISQGPSDYPHGTRIQIEVSSINESIIKATKHGALILREKMEFEDFFLAYLVDPTGNCIALIENK